MDQLEGREPGSRPDILIVGGGTAGWLTAAILAKAIGAKKHGTGVRIALIESSDIPTVGVGEGTFPTIAKTLAMLGVDEADFMRGASAAFKQGIRFVDWTHTPHAGRHSHYYHPFALPRDPGFELLPHWLSGEAGDIPYADAVTLQSRVCDAGRGPKRITDAEFRGPMNYAYHLDAACFGAWLSTVARRLGVEHHVGTVEKVELDEQGAISAVVTREQGRFTAGLYVDCTGFHSQLLGRALGIPFRSSRDVLFVDRAVTVQVPYENERAAIPPYTVSTAHESGWTWDIALAKRRGVGYVYSSRHTDDTRAEAVLRDYVGPVARDLSVRQLKFQVGWRERHWVKNCVAVGLSGGFLEPLESTGIILIEAAAYTIAGLYQPDFEHAARQFNEHMSRRYERIVDFIKLHYFLTQRTDSAFWLDNADPASATESLRAHLDMWRHRPPSRFDFVMDHESFAPANYQFVLYGMGFRTPGPGAAPGREAALARQEFARVRDAARRAVAALPTHRELLDCVYQAGFSFSPVTEHSGTQTQ